MESCVQDSSIHLNTINETLTKMKYECQKVLSTSNPDELSKEIKDLKEENENLKASNALHEELRDFTLKELETREKAMEEMKTKMALTSSKSFLPKYLSPII